MTLDNFAIAALMDELNQKLAGGRIQDTVQLERESFGMEVYANRERLYLYLSADNLQPHAMLVPEKIRRGVQTPSPMGLLFRQRVEGAILRAVRQPTWERILIFDLMTAEGEFQVILEMIERRANLILVENEMILECARRVGPQENRHRAILPRQPYIPPPSVTQDRMAPDKVTPVKLANIFHRDPQQKAWLALVTNILGFSPLLAKEAIFRAHKNLNITAAEANPYGVDAALGSFLPPLLRRGWRPGIAVDSHNLAQGVAVFPLTHLGEWRETKSISEAISIYFGSLEGDAAYEAARQPVREQIEKAREKLSRKLASLRRSMREDQEVEFLRQAGELILAYQYTLQKGQDKLIAQYDIEGEPLEIKLDTTMTPLENAQNYFARYEKAKRARNQIPDHIEETEREIALLDQLETDLTLAENWQDIGEVQSTLQSQGYWQGKQYTQPKGGRAGPLKISTPEGFMILVGRNARQNEEVSFKLSEPYDIWMHARNSPGAHVVVKTNAREVPERVLLEAASYAAYYSKQRQDTKVEVMVTQCRYIRKRKGGHAGQVLVSQEQNSLYVPPKKPEG